MGYQRDLRSFPTRRSSDLGAAGPRRRPPGRSSHRSAGCAAAATGNTRGAPRVFPVRSEEHTSELQSQSNLVCRLLLEKKKTIREKIHSPEHPDVAPTLNNL